jgi:malate dehydrogenase
MATIGIIGSGNVGANTAFFVAERDVAHVCLYDVKDGLSTGKALDMMEDAPLREYRHRLRGTDDLNEVLDAEVIVVAAGEVRAPGERREDLYERNKPVVDEIAARLASWGGVTIVATEPVDPMTMRFVAAGLDRRRVIGIGGALDSARLRVLIARELGTPQEDVKATVIGRHSDDMIALPAYCSVAGVPVTTLISDARLSELISEAVETGDRIVNLAQRSSSYYGPAAVATDIAEAVIRDTNRVLSVSLMFDGQYGITGVAMSLPALIGAKGIVRVLEPKLSDEEQARLSRSAASLKAYE